MKKKETIRYKKFRILNSVENSEANLEMIF